MVRENAISIFAAAVATVFAAAVADVIVADAAVADGVIVADAAVADGVIVYVIIANGVAVAGGLLLFLLHVE